MSELTIEEVLRLGTEAHQAGNIRDADRYYTAILKAQPNHAEGNHSMGLLAVSLKKFEQAIPYFEKAIRFNPNASQFWLSLFEVLIKLEKFDEARDLLDRAQNQGLNGEILD